MAYWAVLPAVLLYAGRMLLAPRRAAHEATEQDTLPAEPAPAPVDSLQELFHLPLPTGGTLAVWLPAPHATEPALRWLLESRGGEALGMDVEGHVALLQLATRTRAVLLRWRPLADAAQGPAAQAFAALCTLLGDPAVPKCGVELRAAALALLGDSGHRARLCNGADLSPALRRPSAAGARGAVMGLVEAYKELWPGAPVEQDAEARVSDWEASTLSRRQQSHAALHAWMSCLLGTEETLVTHPNVARVAIREVSPQLSAAPAVLRRVQALRSRAGDADVAALADKHTPGKWRQLGDGERVLVCSALKGKLARGQCVDVKLRAAPHVWHAVVLARRYRTAVLCADPTAPAQALGARCKVVGTRFTRRTMETEAESLKRLTEAQGAQPRAHPEQLLQRWGLELDEGTFAVYLQRYDSQPAHDWEFES